jgi:hypothetical protein
MRFLWFLGLFVAGLAIILQVSGSAGEETTRAMQAGIAMMIISYGPPRKK